MITKSSLLFCFTFPQIPSFFGFTMNLRKLNMHHWLSIQQEKGFLMRDKLLAWNGIHLPVRRMYRFHALFTFLKIFDTFSFCVIQNIFHLFLDQFNFLDRFFNLFSQFFPLFFCLFLRCFFLRPDETSNSHWKSSYI